MIEAGVPLQYAKRQLPYRRRFALGQPCQYAEAIRLRISALPGFSKLTRNSQKYFSRSIVRQALEEGSDYGSTQRLRGVVSTLSPQKRIIRRQNPYKQWGR